jgi:hypothetical protein
LLEDFKGAISKRRTPKNLIFLGRFLFLLIFTTIVISIVDYALKVDFLVESRDVAHKLVMNEARNIRMVELL